MTKSQIEKTENRISKLPSGGITYKTINGKRYAYYQWSEDGKQHSRRVKDTEFDTLSAQIKERKLLQEKLKESNVKPASTKSATKPAAAHTFSSPVLSGEELKVFSDSVKGLPKRSCFAMLSDFVQGSYPDKVMILHGLRSSGKTTLIRQAIVNLGKKAQTKAAYMRISSVDSKAFLSDIKELVSKGYTYLFIDEASHLDGLPDTLAHLADIYASRGIRIVVSGTDSLAFALDKDGLLYGKCVVLKTTFVPYEDFCTINPNTTVEDYIRYGGTMIPVSSGIDNPFFSYSSVSEYLENAVIKNISHSLSANSLPESDAVCICDSVRNCIRCISENYLLNVLQKYPECEDLSTCFIKYIGNSHQSVCLKEYSHFLSLAGFTVDVPVYDLHTSSNSGSRTLFVQPGLCYSLVQLTLTSFFNDKMFNPLSGAEKNYIIGRVLTCIKEQLFSDVVLLHSIRSFPEHNVAEASFDLGSYDVVVFDRSVSECNLTQASLSSSPAEKTVFLQSDEFLSQAERMFGTVACKSVVYPGEDKYIDSIQYINADCFLISNKSSKKDD